MKARLAALVAVLAVSAVPASAKTGTPGPKPKAGAKAPQKQAQQAQKPAQNQPQSTTKDFPRISVTDLATGEPFALESLGALNKPVLVWFWAPT